MRIPGSVLIAGALTCAVLLNPGRSEAALEIGVSVNIAPPELPVYEQPEVPGPDYIWTPGYWAWSDDGYYWVPGTWVEPPEAGLLWTPGYWGWEDGIYRWHGGYWGPEIGFYGGVNYGFGYFGHGYSGGYWDRGRFRYNSAYSNVRGNRQIVNVYNRTVVNNITVNRISYNGGHGGLGARPNPHELSADRARHVEPVAAQLHQMDAARGNPELRANFNHGRPPVAATPRAGEFSGQGVVPARGASPAFNHAPNTPAAERAGPEARVQAEQHGPLQIQHDATPGQGRSGPAQPFQQQHEQPQQQHAAPPSPGAPGGVPTTRFEHGPGGQGGERTAPAPQVHTQPQQQQFHPPQQQQPQQRPQPPAPQVHAPPAQAERAAPAAQFHAPSPPPQQRPQPPPAAHEGNHNAREGEPQERRQ